MTRLPLATSHFVPGHGTRRDCASYDACLTASVDALKPSKRGKGRGRNGAPLDIDAHCPEACRWHEPPARERATSYSGTGRGAGGE